AHRVLGLALCADKEDGLTAVFGDHVGHELDRLAKHLLGFLQIDNVDAVSLAENVLLHFRVPTANLVAEMHAGLQQLFHRNRYKTTFSFMSIGLCTRRDWAPEILGQPIKIA